MSRNTIAELAIETLSSQLLDAESRIALLETDNARLRAYGRLQNEIATAAIHNRHAKHREEIRQRDTIGRLREQLRQQHIPSGKVAAPAARAAA